eukprot:c21045_g1_i4 orf=346-609(-)
MACDLDEASNIEMLIFGYFESSLSGHSIESEVWVARCSDFIKEKAKSFNRFHQIRQHTGFVLATKVDLQLPVLGEYLYFRSTVVGSS